MKRKESVMQDRMKYAFYANLYTQFTKQNSVLLTKEKYYSIIEDLKRIKACNKKESSRDYRLVQRYDIMTIKGHETLIVPFSDKQKSFKKFVHAEELFDILYSTHIATSHGGRDKMFKQIKTLYKNITQVQIRMFLDLCETCQHRQKIEKICIIEKPYISSQFNSRCHVNLIDYQSQPDGKFKFLLVYKDHLTKFVVLRPLSSNRADEVANQLLDIFLLFGAPCILHSDHGYEFRQQLLDYLHNMWPELKMIHGNDNSQSFEEVNQDIENMLTTWMGNNQTNKWSEGVRFVQFMKNRTYHTDISKSPHEAMFGGPAKMGLNSPIIPHKILNALHNEEDLEKLKAFENTVLDREHVIESFEKLKNQPVQNTANYDCQLPSTSKILPGQVQSVDPDVKTMPESFPEPTQSQVDEVISQEQSQFQIKEELIDDVQSHNTDENFLTLHYQDDLVKIERYSDDEESEVDTKNFFEEYIECFEHDIVKKIKKE